MPDKPMVSLARATGPRPFFSIVTICRDNLSGIRNCVRSIRKQGFASYEHWIIDGGSKDGTVDFLQEQSDDKLRYVSEPDNGIYHAINKGIRKTNGLVILLLHSDDLLSHGALKRVHDCFQTHNSEAVYGDALYFSGDGRIIKYKPARVYGEEVVLRGMPAAHEAMFIRRSVYETLGLYDETYRSAGDYKLVSNMHLRGIRMARTFEVELYKLAGGVSFGSNVDQQENCRLLREHVPNISGDLALTLSSLKNFRSANRGEIHSIYDAISTLNAPNWFFKALAKTLIKIQLGDAPEVDPDSTRETQQIVGARTEQKTILFTIAGLKGVVGGAEKVFVNLANTFKQNTNREVIVSTAEGKAGYPHYFLDPRIRFIDIYEKPYDTILAASLELRSELAEIIHKLPEEILFAVSECEQCRDTFQNWNQFIKNCRACSKRSPEEIRVRLRGEIKAWTRKYGTRVSRWRRLIHNSGTHMVVAFMISTSAQLFVAIRKTQAKLIVSNHGNPIRDYLYQDDWDNSMLDRAIRFFALYASHGSHWLDDSFLQFIPEPVRNKAFVIRNSVCVSMPSPKNHQPSEAKTIVSVGRLVHVKRHDVLINAFAASGLPESGWTLRIFGNGPLEADLRRLITALALERHVFLEGVVDDLSGPLTSASCFVSCSEMEGFGLAVAEALAAGVPVVADANTSGLSKLVRDGSSGILVRKTDKVKGFAEAMAKLALDPILRARLAKGALGQRSGISSQDSFVHWRKHIGA